MSRTRLAPLLLVVATFLAVGCKPAAHKMGAALPTAPPIFQVIPAGTNPNTLKIPGAQGTVLQNSGGVGSWVMDSTGTWVTNPPPAAPDGGFLAAPVANSSLAAMNGQTVKGNAGPDAGTPADLTKVQLTTLINAANPDAGGALTAAGFTNLATVPTGSTLISSYVTPTIDFMAAAASYNFNTPLVSGKKFYFVDWSIVFLTRDATLTTALAFRLEQNGVNLQPGANSTANTAFSNLQAAPLTFSPGGSVGPGTPPDMTSFPIQFHVVTPAAGSGLTTCTGFFVLTGFYL